MTTTAQARILVVDDDPLLLRMARRMLRPVAAEVLTADSVEVALSTLETTTVHLVLSDLRMGERGGESLLAEVKQRWPQLPVVIITSHGTIDLAVTLMQQGATDFARKPIEREVLLPRIERALSRAALEGQVVELQDRLTEVKAPKREIIGSAPAFKKVVDRLPMVARVDAAVLITGETGTGKELVARALHDLSARARRPFVAVNCGALPENLLESELFGHSAGAFTGARGDKRGLVAEAEGGTLFLDEIGDIPLSLQVKLLRFLQEGEIRPVGATRTVPVDVRIIAATHRNLIEAIEEGSFREDLYYRLNVVPLQLPPLRERIEDVPALAEHCLKRAKRASNRSDLRFGADALLKLRGHGWPGNARELENVVQRAVIFTAGSVIEAENIEFDTHRAAESLTPDLDVPLKEAKDALVAQFERNYLELALSASGGNVSQAARRAGKERKSFHDLIQRYGIEVDRHRS